MRSQNLKVRPVSLTGQVVDLLRHSLLAGMYQPGERFNEVELAAEFGVSRGPVREAIQRLASEGLVELLPNKGAQVVELTRNRVVALFELRAALEIEALRLACARRTDDDIAALHSVCVVSPIAFEPEERFPYGLDLAFHDQLFAAAQSPLLAAEAKRIHRQIVLARAGLGIDLDHTKASMAGHEQILDCLCRRDDKKGSQLMRQHIQLVLDQLLVELPHPDEKGPDE